MFKKDTSWREFDGAKSSVMIDVFLLVS